MRLSSALGRLRSPWVAGALSKIFREENFREVFVRSREPRSAHRDFLHGTGVFQFLMGRGDEREPKYEKKPVLEDQVTPGDESK